MKILWILNSPIGETARVLGLSRSQSGTWIDAAMESLLEQNRDMELTIVTTTNISEMHQKKWENVTYICIPAGRMPRGKRISKKHLSLWEKNISSVQPDLIHIWGTEFSLGYDLRKVFPRIPFVYTMQGVMSYISKYSCLYFPEMGKYIGFISKLRCLKYKKEQKLQYAQAKMEQQMIAEADAVIADNEWAISPFASASNADKFHFIRLPIKKQFQKEQWVQAEAEKNTVFCIAGRSGLKGIHQVVKAVSLLKKDYPDISVLIPGNISSRNPSFLFEPPYLEYLRNLIRELGLEDNVQFLGQLTTDEMIHHMKRSQIFLMPSAIENESSTMREAMFLGMPIITSCVGDIYEMVSHGTNGLMYRFEEYEMLAYHIRDMLKHPETAALYGITARENIISTYQNQAYGTDLSQVYCTVRGKTE